MRRLGRTFAGQVLTPPDPGYDEARQVHNGLVDKRPALIARCVNNADVVDAVIFGREQGLELSVRGGGHGVAGAAVTDGGLMIDLSPMKDIQIDPRLRTVHSQPGVTWGEYNDATAAFGLATPGGVVSTTGIAGLTLGGGIGWLMGKYGMAVDNLLSAEVVLASGEIVTASEETDPDLFWAIRGGGGNFGVATSLQYSAHPLTSVLGGPVMHPLADGADVLRFYRELTAGVPDELSLQAALLHDPEDSGTKLSAIALCHAGDDPDRAEADVRAIRDFGSPFADEVKRMPYPDVNTQLDALFQRGTLNYWKSAFLSELSDGAVEAMVGVFETAPTELCVVALEHFHGAVTRVEPTATAYPHRQPGFNLLVVAQWTDPGQTDGCVAWARQSFDALRPHMADRAYVNYLDADDDARVRDAYGPNYERLAELKHRYDPDNLFHLNQNIRPAPEPAAVSSQEGAA